MNIEENHTSDHIYGHNKLAKNLNNFNKTVFHHHQNYLESKKNTNYYHYKSLQQIIIFLKNI